MFIKKILAKNTDGQICECLIGDTGDGNADKETERVLKIIEHDKKIKPLEIGMGEDSSTEDPHGDFQDAWEFDNDKNPTKIVINLEKAKTAWHSRLRGMRDVVLKAMDQDVIVAVGKGDTKLIKKIEKRKQLLRDLPDNVMSPLNKCKTLQEVTEVVPPELIY